MYHHHSLTFILYSCWFASCATILATEFSCQTSSTSKVLLSNGPPISFNSPYAQTLSVNFLFQSPFQLASAIQVSAINIFPRQNNVSLTIRAALYDAASMLIAQTPIITTSTAEFSNTQSNPWSLPLERSVNLAVGINYHVAYWFANSSNNGTGVVALYATSPANATWLKPTADFVAVNGSFPALLSAPHTFGSGRAAPFIELIGKPCLNKISAATIHLDNTVLSILQTIRTKYGGIPALGASIIQMPTSDSFKGVQPIKDTVCPFIPVSTVVSGVRRADAKIPEPVTVNDKWHLGSNTKAMTAMLVQILIQKGRLSLNTTVGDIFPYLPFSSMTTTPSSSDSCVCGNLQHTNGYFSKSPYSCNLKIHTSWKYITIAHLLTHTSGLDSLDALFTEQYFIDSVALDTNGFNESCTNYPIPSRRYHLSVMLPVTIPNSPPSIDVPVKSAYSNNNFILLGLILEELLSLPWEIIIQQQLFDPLGMSTAGFLSPITNVSLDAYAIQPLGHYKDHNNIIRSVDSDLPKSWAPTGLVHASLGDWSKFIACQLQEGRDLAALGFSPANTNFLNITNSLYIFSPSVWQSIHDRYTFPSANSSVSSHSLSELINENDQIGLSLMHTGSNTVWYAYIAAYPRLSQPMAVLVTANIGIDDVVWEAKAAIINLYLAWQEQGQPASTITSTAPLSVTLNNYFVFIFTFFTFFH
ncbi:unnamed protein product [Adineta ricciae]|uniref:Beta-lactamase-related domain-containing protein n=1 Tax=Adineta ricciae TaxID=249248 RepID=A0A815GK19_ADIRI|nr:unnamed protein product [Adineta ricciae]CAF1340897.1 unnamed protein product [Adineta ricciae]